MYLIVHNESKQWNMAKKLDIETTQSLTKANESH